MSEAESPVSGVINVSQKVVYMTNNKAHWLIVFSGKLCPLKLVYFLITWPKNSGNKTVSVNCITVPANGTIVVEPSCKVLCH